MIINLKAENARRKYYEAMGETNRLMEKWDVFERDKHPEYRKAAAKERKLLEEWQREVHR